MKMKHFKTVADGTEILISDSQKYMMFYSDLDVCNDGSGPAHGDPDQQDQTSYNPTLNADSDLYIVYHPSMRTGIQPIFLGCMGRVTNLVTRKTHWGVWGDCGPDNITGETAYALAKILNPAISYNTGDKNRVYLYEAWPGVPAVVNGKHYKLQPV